MKAHNPYITQLFQKYLDGNYSEEELEQLLDYFDLEENSEQLKSHIQQQFDKAIPAKVDMEAVQKIVVDSRRNVMRTINRPAKVRTIKWWYVAASLLLICSIAAVSYWYLTTDTTEQRLTSKYGEDVLPGANRAYITLGDGSRIDLSESKEGVLIGEDGISYEDGSSITDKQPTQATIHTPNGGQYRVTLSDGSKVTLNSASSLSYPSRFSDNARLVTLTGEAYFEVTRNTNAPFKVNSTNQEIEVLGTSFNVSTYNAEKAITTLVEGSIKLNTNTGHSTLLRPGQQATLDNSKFHVQTVSTEDYTAWMHNQFVFNAMTLAETFAQLERWYDISFDYPSSMDNERIYAEISRDRKLSEVLNTLEEIVPVTFTISGRRVTVQRK